MKTSLDYEKLLNTTVKNVPPSGIRRFFDVAAEIEGCISLGLGEPDFDTPTNVRNAGIASIEARHTTYTSSAGISELRELVARYYRERFNVPYNSENVICTIGTSEAIDLAYRILVNPGDEVMIPQPAYVSYQPCLDFVGGVCSSIITSAKNDFKLTREAIEKAITPKTKALLIPYPSNPTGATMTRAELTDALAPILDTDIIIISDEIYAELNYGEEGHCAVASIPGMFERTITLNGFSKAFAMTGWRLGYACGPTALIDQMIKVHTIIMLSGSYTSQDAGIEALSSGFAENFAGVEKMRDSYKERRDYLVSELNSMGLACPNPSGAFYCFPSVGVTGLGSEEFAERLLFEAKVAVVPGVSFGAHGEGHVRISYAYSMEHLKEAMTRIRIWLETNGWHK